jgi:hypothetical protein
MSRSFSSALRVLMNGVVTVAVLLSRGESCRSGVAPPASAASVVLLVMPSLMARDVAWSFGSDNETVVVVGVPSRSLLRRERRRAAALPYDG